jgi:hypothetical protein
MAWLALIVFLVEPFNAPTLPSPICLPVKERKVVFLITSQTHVWPLTSTGPARFVTGTALIGCTGDKVLIVLTWAVVGGRAWLAFVGISV